jgi:hypothetical protein
MKLYWFRILVLGLVVLSGVPALARPPQFSLRAVLVAAPCAALLTVALIKPWIEGERQRAYSTPKRITSGTPVAELRQWIAASLPTAIASHGHFLSYEDAVAIAVEADFKMGIEISSKYPEWGGYVSRIQAERYGVSRDESGKITITFPRRSHRDSGLFVEALLTIYLAKSLRADPPGARLLSVESLFLYANPGHSEMAPMNVIKIVAE